MAYNLQYVYCENSKSTIETSRIIKDINNGFKIIIFMRGLPGSGKSTLAKSIIQSTVSFSNLPHILSTDDYFKNSIGKYNYDVTKLAEAHTWNQMRASDLIRQGVSPIIIDNTNLELWEMKPYAVSGIENGYILKILELKTAWALKPNELARRNSHGVPISKIKKMLEKYQLNVCTDTFMKHFNLSYDENMKPPILRLAPILPNKSPEKFLPYIIGNKLLQDYNKKYPVDLIDLSEITGKVVPSQSTVNIPKSGDELEKPIEIDSSDSNDSWSETWVKSSTSKPRPQRESKESTVTKFKADYNWTPIDESLSCRSFGGNRNNSILSDPVNKKNFRDVSTSPPNYDYGLVENLRVLSVKSREINTEAVVLPKILKTASTLDKSVMTENDEEELQFYISEENAQVSFEVLKNMFANIPDEHLRDILSRCNDNLNWAIDILLENTNCGSVDFSHISYQKDRTPLIEEKLEELDILTNDKTTPKQIINNEPKTPKFLRKEKIPLKNNEQLKKVEQLTEMERRFQFSDDHYSEHTLNLKKRLHGEKFKYNCDTVREVRSSSESSDDSEPEPVISFRMGRDFFQQLDDRYGSVSSWDEKLEPIIHIPESLANQIHALWLESVCNQIEVQRQHMKVIMEEDEQLARELEAKEREQIATGKELQVSNMKDIIDMELALADYDYDGINEWRHSPEDLASKLTQQKLCQMFPDIEENILIDIYKAHDCNFEQTFEVLLLSTGKISSLQTQGVDHNTLKKILEQFEKELVERANKAKQDESNKANIFDLQETMTITDTDGNKQFLDNKTAVLMFRQQASKFLNLRNINFAKAKDCMLRGSMAHATYYSQLATIYIRKYDYYNNLAASRLMQVSSTGRDLFTLDLHHLFVVEAIQIMDMFLDKHISQMNENPDKKNHITLFLITGRGRHSPNGKPRIKPAVKKRLLERSLPYYEVNPGLLGVFITQDLCLSSPSTSYRI